MQEPLRIGARLPCIGFAMECALRAAVPSSRHGKSPEVPLHVPAGRAPLWKAA